MKFPAPWLIYSVVVHGLLGSFGELLDIMINRLSSPLSHFYNESIHSHYGSYIDGHQVTVVTSLLENSAIGGSILSVIFLIPRMDSWGRKNIAVYVRAGIGIFAASLIIIAKNFNTVELFGLAQIFSGFVRPLKLGVAKAYISECSPDETRGLVTQGIASLTFVLVIFSAVLTLPFAFGNEQRWHWMAGFSLLIAIIFIIFGSFIPESPKYMLVKGKPKKIVKETIKKFHGKNADTDAILDDYECEFRTTKTTHESYKALWNDMGLRESLYLVIVAALVPSIGPPQIYHLYAIPLKIRYGFTNSQALLLDTTLSFFYAPAIFLLPYLYERIGRRPIFLLATLFGAGASCLLFFAEAVVSIQGPSLFTIILSILFTLFIGVEYALGAAFFFVILIQDFFPTGAKATATQLVILLHNVASIIVNFGYANFEKSLGPFIYLPFIIAQLFFFFYAYRNLPETRQRPVYQNFEIIRSRAVSRRQSILSRSRTSTHQYGAV